MTKILEENLLVHFNLIDKKTVKIPGQIPGQNRKFAGAGGKTLPRRRESRSVTACRECWYDPLETIIIKWIHDWYFKI